MSYADNVFMLMFFHFPKGQSVFAIAVFITRMQLQTLQTPNLFLSHELQIFNRASMTSFEEIKFICFSFQRFQISKIQFVLVVL